MARSQTHINYYSCRTDRLTWNNLIPNSELWVKLGADKGGSSFKMNFQIVNVPHPNSIRNTVVFTAFEAPDSITNLNICLERYQGPVSLLQSHTWRYVNITLINHTTCMFQSPHNRDKSVRVFLSGDYEFLCKMYGISGATGKKPYQTQTH